MKVILTDEIRGLGTRGGLLIPILMCLFMLGGTTYGMAEESLAFYALIIAAMKGSMVAAVFMHLSHEKRFVYATLVLTAVFFLGLLLLPLFTSLDSLEIGSAWSPVK